jgi:glycosyltransferase involved in cell wall biosynthesis
MASKRASANNSILSEARLNFVPNVSAMIFTLNEAIHLPSCLASLSWCDDVVVVDSFSSDATEEICARARVRFVQHAFAGFGAQRNWALDNVDVKHDWILILDADERVPSELAREMNQLALENRDDVGAYRLKRRFYMWGRWLKYSSLYPTWVVRFVHKKRVRFANRGHAETQTVQGETLDLQNDLIDENLKGIDEWFERQNRYSRKEAEYELAGNEASGRLLSADPLERRAAIKRITRNLPFRGLAYFLYAYVLRRGFLDGRDGLMFCRMRALYQVEIEMKKYDRKRNAANAGKRESA